MKTDKMTKIEMAKALIEELGWSDRDAEWTFANQFKKKQARTKITSVKIKIFIY